MSFYSATNIAKERDDSARASLLQTSIDVNLFKKRESGTVKRLNELEVWLSQLKVECASLRCAYEELDSKVVTLGDARCKLCGDVWNRFAELHKFDVRSSPALVMLPVI